MAAVEHSNAVSREKQGIPQNVSYKKGILHVHHGDYGEISVLENQIHEQLTDKSRTQRVNHKYYGEISRLENQIHEQLEEYNRREAYLKYQIKKENENNSRNREEKYPEGKYEIKAVKLVFNEDQNNVKIYPVKCLRDTPIHKYVYDEKYDQLFPDYQGDSNSVEEKVMDGDDDGEEEEDEIRDQYEDQNESQNKITDEEEYQRDDMIEKTVRLVIHGNQRKARDYKVWVMRDIEYDGYYYNEENDCVIPNYIKKNHRYEEINEDEYIDDDRNRAKEDDKEEIRSVPQPGGKEQMESELRDLKLQVEKIKEIIKQNNRARGNQHLGNESSNNKQIDQTKQIQNEKIHSVVKRQSEYEDSIEIYDKNKQSKEEQKMKEIPAAVPDNGQTAYTISQSINKEPDQVFPDYQSEEFLNNDDWGTTMKEGKVEDKKNDDNKKVGNSQVPSIMAKLNETGKKRTMSNQGGANLKKQKLNNKLKNEGRMDRFITNKLIKGNDNQEIEIYPIQIKQPTQIKRVRISKNDPETGSKKVRIRRISTHLFIVTLRIEGGNATDGDIRDERGRRFRWTRNETRWRKRRRTDPAKALEVRPRMDKGQGRDADDGRSQGRRRPGSDRMQDAGSRGPEGRDPRTL